MTSLYGFWQTEPWEPPAAADGRVPRNERGNVEVPPFAKALPKGTRHLSGQGLAAVARLLGVDFAPALAGFDLQGGRMVPRIDGIVVCQVRHAASGGGLRAGAAWSARRLRWGLKQS
jgi:xeroderma pigmentosum group C-complementing protein